LTCGLCLSVSATVVGAWRAHGPSLHPALPAVNAFPHRTGVQRGGYVTGLLTSQLHKLDGTQWLYWLAEALMT
jgi:tetrahydromethanopterin S-methyltransferase subunit B